jgi:hypothetical protein
MGKWYQAKSVSTPTLGRNPLDDCSHIAAFNVIDRYTVN